jgi:hypothetical protein
VVPAELGGNIRGVVGAIRDTAFGNRHAKASKQASKQFFCLILVNIHFFYATASGSRSARTRQSEQLRSPLHRAIDVQ